MIEALGHDEIAHDGKAATCTESGYEAYVACSRCDHTTYTVIEALGHDEINHEAKAATCTESGYKAYVTCSRCDHTTYTVIKALGHDEIAHDGKAATCTEDGYKAYVTCSRCDYTTYSKIFAAGHIYENGICSGCGEEEPDVIKHVVYIDNGVDVNKYNIIEGNTIPAPSLPDRIDFTFIGWYCGDSEWNFATDTVSEEIVIYAKWRYDAESYLTYTVTDGEATITGYTGSSTTVIIPAEIDGYPVVAIGNNAFLNNRSITAVIIENGVESINEKAFYRCTSLTSVRLGSTVSYIGWYAFVECAIEEISLPYGLESLSNGVFARCKQLRSVTIPATLTYFDQTVFDSCTNLKSVYISDMDAWYSTGFYSLNSNPMCNGADLYLNGNLVTEVIVPEYITSIPDYLFDGCTSITRVVLHEGLTNIGGYAFYNCSNIEYNVYGNTCYIATPENPYFLCAIAVSNNVSSIEIHEDTKYISNYVIRENKNLEVIYFNAVAMYDRDDGAFYARNSNSNSAALVIGSAVTGVPANLFQNSNAIASVEFEDNSVCESIGSYAFYGCSRMTSLELPESLVTIGASAFNSCSQVTSLTLPENLTSIGKSAFYGCRGLTEIYLKSIALDDFIINNEVFQGIGPSAIKLVIGKDVTRIPACFLRPDGMGSASPNIVSIEFEKGSVCQSIGKYAFSGAYNFTSIELPDSISYIGEYAFAGCSSLVSIEIPEAVTRIENDTFNGCMGLTTIKMHGNITFIGNYAFASCYSLVDITIPKGITQIGEYTFASCTSLTKVVLPAGVKTVGMSAFSKCSALTSIVVPESLKTIYFYAFDYCANLSSIYYEGNADKWSSISVWSSDGSLEAATVYYYCENANGVSGNYWYYNENGGIVAYTV